MVVAAWGGSLTSLAVEMAVVPLVGCGSNFGDGREQQIFNTGSQQNDSQRGRLEGRKACTYRTSYRAEVGAVRTAGVVVFGVISTPASLDGPPSTSEVGWGKGGGKDGESPLMLTWMQPHLRGGEE